MPAATVQPSQSARRRKAKPRGLLAKIFILLIQVIFSPLAILWDSFQPKKGLDRSWTFAFFLLTSVLMLLTGLGLLVADGPVDKTLKLMANLAGNEEVLPGTTQPVLEAINDYALQNRLDPNLVYAIVKSESNFNPKAVSRAGARGLMQLMPEVWREYSNSSCTGNHPPTQLCDPQNCIYVPEANLRAGTRYLRALLDRYDDRVDLALEAYNAGMTNVEPGQAPKFEETRNYIQKTIGTWRDLRKTTLIEQIRVGLSVQGGLKVLFGLSFLCWLILFWWASRKLFAR